MSDNTVPALPDGKSALELMESRAGEALARARYKAAINLELMVEALAGVAFDETVPVSRRIELANLYYKVSGASGFELSESGTGFSVQIVLPDGRRSRVEVEDRARGRYPDGDVVDVMPDEVVPVARPSLEQVLDTPAARAEVLEALDELLGDDE